MADNVVANANTSTGATFRAFSDGTNEWPAAVCCYVTGGSAGAWTLSQVQLANGLPVQPATGASWAVTGTFWQATQPVSIAATVTVSGTVTANIGTTNGLALDASVTGLQVAQGSTTSGQKGGLALGAVTTAAPSYTTAQTSPLSLTTGGLLRTDGSGVTQPVSGTITANAGSGTFTVSGTVTANAGTGNFTVVQATGTNLHAVLDSGSTTAVTQATASNLNAQVQGAAASGASKAGNPVQVGGVFNTTQPTVTTGQAVEAQATARGALIVATGTDTFSVSAAQSGTWNIGTVTTVTTVSTVTAVTSITNALPSGTNTIGNTVPVAATSGGATPYSFIAAAGANQDSTVVKASAGQVYSVAGFSIVSGVRWLKLYDKATGPTSSDTPIARFLLPTQGNTQGGGFTQDFPVGLVFTSGIAFRITTGIADSDANAAAANDCAINLSYK